MYAVWLLVYREVAHVRPRGHRRPHRRPWLQLWLGLILVWMMVLRMVLYLGILWRLLLVLMLVLLVLMLVLVLVGMRWLLLGMLLDRPRMLRLSLCLLLVVEAAHTGKGQ